MQSTLFGRSTWALPLLAFFAGLLLVSAPLFLYAEENVTENTVVEETPVVETVDDTAAKENVTETEPSSEESATDSSEASTQDVTDETSVEENTSTESDSNESQEAATASALNAPTQSPELSTDKAEYHPRETATIFGKFFQSLQTIVLKIFGGSVEDNTYIESTQNVTSDTSGAFTTTYTLDSVFRPLYTVTALSLEGTTLAQISFEDPVTGAGDLDQSHNGGIGDTPISPVEWVNGNANAQNSHFFEGDSIPYRMVFTGLPTGNNFVDIEWDTKHSGGVAIDYITSPDRINELVQPLDGLAGTFSLPNPFDIPPPTGVNIPETALLAGLPASSAALLPADQRQMDIYNGTISSIDYLPPTGDFSDSVNVSSQRARITFNASASTVVLSWGGHIASRLEWGSLPDGTPRSAGGINGSPYHTRFIQLCNGLVETKSACGGGNQDRSLSAAAIILPSTGTIIVDKVTLPAGDPQSFNFVAGGTGYANFSLTDAAAHNNQVLGVGSYSVTETVPAGWDQTSAVCVSSIQDVETPGNLELDADETITCTFTNTKRGTIIVEKQTSPDQTAGNFTFTGTAADTIADNGQITVSNLVPGQYTSTENNPAPTFALTNISCDDSNSTGNTGTRVATFNLDPGETVKCTFTNTLQVGQLTVQKTTIPGGDATVFNINAAGTGSITGGGAGTVTDALDKDYEVTAGTYSVTETVPAGWAETSNTCVDVVVTAGQTSFCTITNTKQGKILIDKVTNPTGSGQSFEFNPSWSAQNFNLTDAAAPADSGFLAPNTYSVSEVNIPTGWNITNTTCSDESPVNAISLQAGETVTCTFTNTQDATLIVKKVMVGGSSTFDFTGTPNGSISVNNGTIQTTVNPGQHISTEAVEAGWDLTSVVCDDSNSTGNVGARTATFNAEAGETVTCTFTNTERGKIIVEKVTVGGDAQFEFDSDYGSNFSLGNGQSNDSGFLVPGTYDVDEVNIPTGWAKTSATCSDQSPITAIELGAGETVTCTFTNNKPAAQIDVTPLSAFNKINDPHVITGTVQVHNGNGTWGPAADGTLITFSLVNNNNSSAFVGGNTCNTSAGSCSVTINTGSTGSVEIHAAAAPTPLGVTVNVQTDGVGENSANGVKTYVNAKISIAGTDVNEVDDDHIFTVKVEKDTGAGLVPVSGENPVVTFSPGNPGSVVDNCNLTGTDGAGECTVVINSSVGGIFTASAALNLDVNGVVFNLVTNGQAPNSGTATKTYVDGSIALTPQEAINNVNDPHEITAHVTQNDGGVTTDVVGATVTFFVTSGSATFVGNDNDCVTAAGGLCSVSINSATPGNNTINASTTFTVNTVQITRATDGDAGPLGSNAAEKEYQGGIIIVQKVTNPSGDPATFDFTASYDNDGFTLGDGGEDNSGYIAVGTYSVSETVPSGWDLESATCDDGSDPASIGLENGETVTCKFTNEKDAFIIVDKVTDPALDPAEFDFTTDYSSPFTLADASPANNSGDLDPGTYDVNEASETGWDNTAISCVSSLGDPADNDGQNLDLDAGETITCTFTNQKDANIIVKKETLPDGSNEEFAFDPSWSVDDFDLADGDMEDSNDLNPGPYSVVELAEEGWDLTNTSCVSSKGDQETAGAISLQAGETVTCTFTNTQRGNIIVDKVTVGGDDTFLFNATGGVAPEYIDFSLTGAGAPNNQQLKPGAYSVTESALAGWDLEGVNCVSSLGHAEVNSALDLNPGEIITCTFTNEKDAKIIVDKITIPSGSPTSFNFTPSWTSGFSLTDAADPHDSGDLATSTYSVSETVPAGWDLATPVCVSSNENDVETAGAISLQAGETVTCTFTNTERGDVKVVKNAIGGDAEFSFTHSIAGLLGSLTTVSNTANDTSDKLVPASNYAVTEDGETGWDLTAASCKLADGTTSTGTVIGGAITGITVQPGKTTTCTFENTKRGHLIVQKTTLPAADTTEFSILASGSGSITGGGAGVVTDATDKDYEVTPGTYSVAETVPAGWDKTVDTCESVVVGPGETKYCGFTNVKRATITIVKDAEPNDTQDFAFSGTLGAFTLDDDAGVVDPPAGEELNEWSNTKTTSNVVPGQITVTETQPNQYWKLDTASCVLTGTDTPVASQLNGDTLTFTADPGADVTCTFQNDKLSPTRTQGFWQTHTTYTTGIFNGFAGSFFVGQNVVHATGTTHLGKIETINKLFGGFFSNIAKKTSGAQRTALDKARMQLAQQLIAAKLNCAAFGCSADVQAKIANADNAYASGTVAQILAAAAEMDSYNNSGDTIIIGNAGKATPKTSQSLADKAFWDTP